MKRIVIRSGHFLPCQHVIEIARKEKKEIAIHGVVDFFSLIIYKVWFTSKCEVPNDSVVNSSISGTWNVQSMIWRSWVPTPVWSNLGCIALVSSAWTTTIKKNPITYIKLHTSKFYRIFVFFLKRVTEPLTFPILSDNDKEINFSFFLYFCGKIDPQSNSTDKLIIAGTWSHLEHYILRRTVSCSRDLLNSYSASHDNWCTAILWNRIITAQCEGMGEVGSARYEPALLPPCPSIRVLCYSNCQRSTQSHQQFKG